MKRSIHIFVSLVAVVLLARPFDCFASAKPNQEAMDCCLKGKCAPTAQSDNCCKNTAPDGGQLVLSKVASHSVPLIALPVAPAPVGIPESYAGGSIDLLRHPPPPTGLTAHNLPLLI